MTDRHSVDSITSDALDALYESLEAAQDTELYRQLQTADQAFASASVRAALLGDQLAKARALHQPQADGTGFPDGWQCRTCSQNGGDGYQYLVPWPCPTAQVLAVPGPADDGTTAAGPHVYLSTGCHHGDTVLPDGRTGHQYCQAMTGLAGTKRPAECKFCHASCQCECHTQTVVSVHGARDLTPDAHEALDALVDVAKKRITEDAPDCSRTTPDNLREQLAAAVDPILDEYPEHNRTDERQAILSEIVSAVIAVILPNMRTFAGLYEAYYGDVSRVIALYERWVKAGPPPLGVSLSRWWDQHLVELHQAILPTDGQAGCRCHNIDELCSGCRRCPDICQGCDGPEHQTKEQ